jgi:hypothetical protein
MATLTADRAAATFPVFAGEGGGNVKFAYGVYEISSALAQNDVVQMCKVPAGAYIVDGFIRADDLDTGTEALDIDVGTSADTDALGNLGVWTGDAVTDLRPETRIYYPFNGVLKDGPLLCSSETTIQLLCNAAANAGGTGTVYCGVYYIVP